MLDEDARKRIRGAARRERHDNGDGSLRIGLCLRRERPRRRAAEKRR